MALEKIIKVTNTLGIHARPSAAIVKTAIDYRSDITIEKEGKVVDAKSIMGLLILAAERGSTLVIRANGPDEVESIEQLCEVISNEDLLECRKPLVLRNWRKLNDLFGFSKDISFEINLFERYKTYLSEDDLDSCKKLNEKVDAEINNSYSFLKIDWEYIQKGYFNYLTKGNLANFLKWQDLLKVTPSEEVIQKAYRFYSEKKDNIMIQKIYEFTKIDPVLKSIKQESEGNLSDKLNSSFTDGVSSKNTLENSVAPKPVYESKQDNSTKSQLEESVQVKSSYKPLKEISSPKVSLEESVTPKPDYENKPEVSSKNNLENSVVSKPVYESKLEDSSKRVSENIVTPKPIYSATNTSIPLNTNSGTSSTSKYGFFKKISSFFGG